MKNLVLIAAVLLGASISQAEMKPPGTLVPSLCSPNPGRAITQVCFAKKTQLEGEYLTTRDAEGNSAVYMIVSRESLTGRATTKTEKLNLVLESLISRDGYVSIPFYAQPATLTLSYSLTSYPTYYVLTGALNGVEVNASKFEMMAHTLGL